MIRFELLFLFSTLCFVNANSQTSWTLVWSDEFSGTTLNTDKWQVEYGNGGWGNNELQYYTSQPGNLSILDGELNITAKQENFGGSNYTSARIMGNNLFEFLYGKVEARIKLPLGQGLWPAFWLLGANIEDVGWPQCGEIDIMEHINTENKVYSTIHWNNNGATSFGGNKIVDVTEYHVYGLLWDDESMQFYVDGIVFFEANITNSVNNTGAFHLPFFVILNMAVGGNWPGNPNGATPFPSTMLVDYVRVYQQITAGVEEDLSGNNPSLYPVPFSESLTIESAPNAGAQKFEVRDLAGHLISQGNLFGKAVSVDTSSWAQGMYIVQITDGISSPQIRKVSKI